MESMKHEVERAQGWANTIRETVLLVRCDNGSVGMIQDDELEEGTDVLARVEPRMTREESELHTAAKAAGWYVEHTGGGCRNYRSTIINGPNCEDLVLVLSDGDMDIPCRGWDKVEVSLWTLDAWDSGDCGLLGASEGYAKGAFSTPIEELAKMIRGRFSPRDEAYR